jgi:hypothetical protein
MYQDNNGDAVSIFSGQSSKVWYKSLRHRRRGAAVGRHPSVWLALSIALALDMTARAGVINGSDTLTTDPGTTNLTTEGTDDWAVWGGTTNNTQGSTSPYDETNVATHEIQGMTLLGGLTVAGLANRTDQNGKYTWSNGTNTPNQSSALPLFMQAYPPNGGPSAGPPTGTGFELKFTATDTLSRTLILRLGYVDVNASLTASLSDSSATPYTSTLSSGAAVPGFAVYTITYHANSPGQTLTVDYTTTGSNGSFDNIGIESASLSAVAVPEPVSLSLLAAGAIGLLVRPRGRHHCV